MAAARGVVDGARRAVVDEPRGPRGPHDARAPRKLRGAAVTLSLLTALAGLSLGGPARADLSDDAARLARMWSLSGARVTRLPPIFVEHGRARVVAVPAPPRAGVPAAVGGAGGAPAAPSGRGARSAGGAGAAAGGRGGQGTPEDECLTVAFLAPRVVEFTLEPEESAGDLSALEDLVDRLRGDDGESERRVPSVAGAAAITRCGSAREGLRRMVVDVLSPRGAFDVVVAASSGPPERVASILPERVFGPVAPRGDPGRPAEPGPLDPRIARAARRARAEGAARVVQTDLRASVVGTGQFSVKLAEGCHRLDLMAEVPTATVRRATDLDAEVREVGTGRLLDRDRSDAPDARLDFCLGEPATVEVPFLGGAGPVKVVLSDAMWPMPALVPGHFGARARGGLAAALRRRRAPEPRAQPIAEAVGAQGDTLVPVQVEPGRCYFAAAAAARGELRGLRLTAEIGDRAARDDAGERGEGAGVAFCSEIEESAAVRVSARGSAPVWVLAVWPMD
ncbi:hypothetical protein SOCE26_070360 [Sorangium cellulosum]|uniref:Uncharacterized protein n=1 Tax=Sorangium cellulosum TaxID=56 RepID=A0A2L0F1T0_SORCE|nr:hypothetical protein [Sorangium cellulosum]AUX45542.1 hypothetical protein SOCE26_070360 [Sorangium cellulosum]